LESSPGLHKCLKIRAQYTLPEQTTKQQQKYLHTETARGVHCIQRCVGGAHRRRCCALTDCSALTLLLPIVSCGVVCRQSRGAGLRVSWTIGVARLASRSRGNVRADFCGWGGEGAVKGFSFFYYYIHIAPFFVILLLEYKYITYMNI
jgi:hypothetical protein